MSGIVPLPNREVNLQNDLFTNVIKNNVSGSNVPPDIKQWVSIEPAFLGHKTIFEFYSQLKQQLNWTQPEVIVFGKKHVIPRLQNSQSDQNVVYQYSGHSLVSEEWHPIVLQIKEKIEQQTGLIFNSVLINYYRDGNDKMGWHSDNEPELGTNPVIACVSLGAEREILFRNRRIKNHNEASNARCSYPVLLTSGSLLVMNAGAQNRLEHQIPVRKKVANGRISLTFRQIIG